MRKYLTSLAICMVATTANAGIHDPTWNPPARYDHAYTGKFTELRLPHDQVVTVCAKVLGTMSYKQHGCSYWNADRSECVVILTNKTFMGATPQAVRRHEIGHCNGWPADHPE